MPWLNVGLEKRKSDILKESKCLKSARESQIRKDEDVVQLKLLPWLIKKGVKVETKMSVGVNLTWSISNSKDWCYVL